MQSPALPTGAYSQHTAPNHSYQYQQQHLHHRRQSSAASTDVLRPPVSPRLIAVGQPQTRAAPPSIKDFEIIKPISKGAFGSVYLSKKKTTGDYFAIKVLKKADMVAKNQVTNVKAERAIMMRQGESDYVAKLYWTFSSKDYLYLVMEYLNGGDCASLIKALGGLPEDWAKRYVAEVVLCVDDLHNRGIVHRDLKPDNLLIDQHGHLKLTDFGLSRMGLVGRQKRVLNSRENESVPDLLRQGPFSNALSVASSRSASFDLHGNHSTTSTPQIASDVAANLSQPSYFNLSRDNSSYRDQSRRTSGYRSDSGGSETLQAMFSNFSLNESPQFIISPRAALPGTDPHSAGSGSPDLYPPVPPSLESQTSAGVPHGVSPKASLMPQPMALFDPEDTGRRFVGTPDYLAPETINGVGQDEMSDWWSLGCILFEFLYGYPPFHDESPDKVFDNILQRKISWPEEEDIPVSSEAKDLMNRLLCLDPRQRLGSNAEDKYASGGDEIRSHPWFRGIRWDTLYQEEAQFIPAPEHPEDTEYFDARGATLQAFTEEMEDQASSAANTPGGEIQDRPHDALSKVRSHVNSLKRGLLPLHIPPHVRDGRTRRLSEPVPTDDFGAFTFKNLPVLEKANKDVLQKLRAGQGTRNTSTGTSLPGHSSAPSLESSPVVQLPPRLFANPKNPNRPPSPLGSDVAAASPTRASQPTSPLLLNFSGGQHHHQRRKTSSTSSGVSYQSSNSLQPGGPEVPRLPSVFKSQSVTCSPIKHPKPLSPLPPSPQMSVGASSLNGPAPRARSQTVGSQDSDLPAKDLFMQQKRRSGIFEVSPSSSDTEEARANALLRVQRRRQSSRRKSRKIVLDGPMFRPLDVLIVDENPVARIIMERLLEKMLCHTISVTNGADAIRYATSDIKFDVILIEYNLKPISGADVARMIRDTKNINAQTPIVAVTGYLKELQSPHHFDDLIEKPPEGYKLANSIGRLCNWKPPPPGQEPSQMRSAPSSSLRHELAGHAESPSSISSGYITVPSATFRGSSREDSVSSSFFGDHESSNADEPSVTIGRPPSVDWRDRGLGILEEAMVEPKHFPPLLQQQSAPPALPSKAPVRQRSAEKIRAKREILERKRHECNESGDDEDEELGDIQVRAKSPQRREQRPSKLAIEMLRTNSRGSVVSASDAPARGDGRTELSAAVLEEPASGDERVTVSVTPPEAVVQSLRMDSSDVDASVTPRPSITAMPVDNDPTPRASTTIYITE
jgi:serine/threonine-protein kinase RIM15